MNQSGPIPVARYALVAVLGLALVFAVILLVRPFIFSFAGARDDANYPLVAASEVDRGPQLIEIVLNDSHGIPGETVDGEHVGITVVAAPLPGGEGYTVVNAWSPANDCPITLGADRLLDCEGHAWTYAGFPIDNADARLPSFPTEVRQGALVVNFTQQEED